MKKIFLATCLMAASVFAATPAAQAPAPAQAPAKAEAAKPAPAPAAAPVQAAKPAPAQAPAPAAAPAQAAQPAPAQAPAPAAAPAQAAQPAAAPAPAPAQAPAPEAAQAQAAQPAAEATPVDSAKVEPAVEEAKAEPAPAAEVKAEEPKQNVSEAQIAANTDAEGFISAPDKEKAQPKKKRKKKKLVENAVVSTDKVDFGILADFELEAGKVFWSSEDDENNDNLETWSGEANFAILAEGENFKGKLALAFYPGDLRDENFGDKEDKQEALRENKNGKLDDYFSLDEAWAYQGNDLFGFKVGRWDNTDKNGDNFGGYIDGYLTGFLSTQDPENQFQFSFYPNDNLDFNVAFISRAVNLDNGDLRAAFNFHGLESLADLKIQLAYRSNIFDKVYDSDSKVKHNASLKASLPLIPEFLNIFAETALLGIANDETMVIPVTGGVLLQTKVIDRIIVEAEYIGDRDDHPEYWGIENPKNVKNVLGSIYLEKAFTDRFSLSASLHSFGCTRDVMLSGNLIGRIN